MFEAHPGFRDAPQDCILVPHQNECIRGDRYHSVTALPTKATVRQMNEFARCFAPLMPRNSSWDTRRIEWGGKVRPAIYARLPGTASTEEFKKLVDTMKECLLQSGLAVKCLTSPMGAYDVTEEIILE